MQIFTLGTSNHKIEEFLGILRHYKIKQVFDVRRWPTSKWFEHFKKENLEKILAPYRTRSGAGLRENKIDYFHFEKLGGYREGGYNEYTKTKDFKEAIKDLIKIIEFKNVAIICAEKLPWKCHRAFITQELEKKGIEIVHIIEKDKIWMPKKEPHEIKARCSPR